jgi:hypothetical protein
VLTDTVVESLLEAGIAHGNADTRWSYWLLFNDTLADLAQGAMLKDRLAKTGETLRKNAKGAEQDKELDEAKSALAAGMTVDVEMRGDGIRVPQVCTCCLGPAELEKPYSYSWQETRVLQRVNRTVSFKFPLCRDCAAHATDESKKAFWLIALPLVGAALLGFLLAQIDDANGWAVAIGSTVAAVTGMLLLSTRIKLSPLAATHACRRDSVRLQPADAHKDVWSVTFANPVYAHAFSQTNGLRKGRPRPSGAYRGNSILGGGSGVTRVIVLAILSMIASGIAFGIASDGRTHSSWSSAPPSRSPSWSSSTSTGSPTDSYPGRAGTPAPPRPSVSTWQPPVRTDPNAAAKTRLSSDIESGKARVKVLEDDVQTMERRLKSIQAEIDLYKSEIDGYESRSRFGGYVNQAAYQTALDAHNARVDSYNELLGRYRSRVREYKEELDSVNAKVDEYNRLVGAVGPDTGGDVTRTIAEATRRYWLDCATLSTKYNPARESLAAKARTAGALADAVDAYKSIALSFQNELNDVTAVGSESVDSDVLGYEAKVVDLYRSLAHKYDDIVVVLMSAKAAGSQAGSPAALADVVLRGADGTSLGLERAQTESMLALRKQFDVLRGDVSALYAGGATLNTDRARLQGEMSRKYGIDLP